MIILGVVTAKEREGRTHCEVNHELNGTLHTPPWANAAEPQSCAASVDSLYALLSERERGIAQARF